MSDLAGRVSELDWYHTIELPGGLVTPGYFDTRAAAREVPLPPSLSGKRCLDVGAFDGFWSFEMEGRGAAEVVAVDVLDPARWDWPRGSDAATVAEISSRKHGNPGFELARGALGSKVALEDRSVYDLEPGDLGLFDVVFMGSLLLHLRDPVRALEAVRSVCRGQVVISDAYDIWLTRRHPRRPVAHLDGLGRPWWWKPNLAALRALVEGAGFELVAEPVRFRMRAGAGYVTPPLRPRTLRTRAGREPLAIGHLGDPHAGLLARPAAALGGT